MPASPTPKIAHVINALRVGGAEKLLVTLAAELARRGLPLTIITLRRSVPAVRAEAEAAGARIVEFHSRKIRDAGRFYRLVRFLNEEKFTVIHTHLTMANILGQLAGRLSGTPAVSSLHNVEMRTAGRHRLQYGLETLLLRQASAVVAVGRTIADAHKERLGHRPIDIIPNAVADLPWLTPAARCTLREQLGCLPDVTLLLGVGRLEPHKGFGDLLEAFARLKQTHPRTRLVVAGDGPDRPALTEQIERLALVDSVHLLGLRQDIPSLLGAADLFVTAAHWEGLPVAVLEAMAAGLPIVATRVGELPEVISPQAGRLVDPQAPAALAAVLRGLLDRPDQLDALGKEARCRYESEFTATTWTSRLLALYERLPGPGEASS